MRKNRFKIHYFTEDGRRTYQRDVLCWTVKQVHEIAQKESANYKITVYQKHYKAYRVLKRYMVLDFLFELLFLPLTVVSYCLGTIGNGIAYLTDSLENLAGNTKYNIKNYFLDGIAKGFGWNEVLENQLMRKAEKE